jgi:5-methylcytosine-specific restriction endonuclease McrA
VARLKLTRKRFNDANRDKIRAYNVKAYWRDPAKSRSLARKYAEAHAPERCLKAKAYYEKNAEYIKARQRAAYAEHPETFRVHLYKRRARQHDAAIGTDRKAYASFIRQVRTAKSLSCYWCNKTIPKGKRHIDHIVPIAKGGADSVENLAASCARCNQTKKAKLPHEFSPQLLLPISSVRSLDVARR